MKLIKPFEKQYGRVRVIYFDKMSAFYIYRPLRLNATWFFQVGKLRIWRDGKSSSRPWFKR